MSDATVSPRMAAPEPPRLHRVMVEFDVRAGSQEEADELVGDVLFAGLAGQQAQPRGTRDRVFGEVLGDEVSHIVSWIQTLPRQLPEGFAGWDVFEGSPIPEMLLEAFPPYPDLKQFRRSDGTLDQGRFDGADDAWRERCIEIASGIAPPAVRTPRSLSMGVIVWSDDPEVEPTVIAHPSPVELARTLAVTVHEMLEDSDAFTGATEFLDSNPPPQDWERPEDVDRWLDALREATPFPNVTFHQVPTTGGADGTSHTLATQLLNHHTAQTTAESAPTAAPEPVPSAFKSEVLVPGWEAFEGSGIPEIVIRMFPPEPQAQDFRFSDGTRDQQRFEDAQEQWRDTCLNLAVEAARLPETLTRLQQLEHLGEVEERAAQAERVRDAVIDLLAREPLPKEPIKGDYLVRVSPSYEGEYDDMAFRWDHSQWRNNFASTAQHRDNVLRSVLSEGGPRTTYLPEEFSRTWMPADLNTIHILRSLVEVDEYGSPRSELPRQQRDEIELLLHQADPDIRVPDPDNPARGEIFSGQASEAHSWLPAGVYEATGDNGRGEYRLVVGTVGDNDETASAAFPPAAHDSIVLNSISRTLEEHTTSHSPAAVLRKVNDAVTGTGRTGALPADLTELNAMTRLERGVLLSELLAEREQALGTDPDGRNPGASGRGPWRNL